MEKIRNFLNYEIIKIGDSGHLTVKMVLVVIAVFIITAIILRVIKKLVTRKLPEEDISSNRSTDTNRTL